MQTKPASKYDLKDLHQAIDLFDRKIAYCQTTEKFDSDMEREEALRKLETRRGTLVKRALAAVSEGIECDPRYLPRSMKNTAEAHSTQPQESQC